MKGFGRYVTFLLASTAPNNRNNNNGQPVRQSLPITTPTASSGATGMKGVMKIVTDAYESIEKMSPTSVSVSDTIQFSLVQPNHRDDENPEQQEPKTRKFQSTQSLFEYMDNRKEQNTEDKDKPIIVYFPGLDCFGISALAQYPELSRRFELWRMSVSVEDRSSFSQLTGAATQFVQDLIQHRAGSKRDIILLGESFGGQVAPTVALKLQAAAIRNKNAKKNTQNNDNATKSEEVDENDDKSPIKGLVLVNPATSFDETNWDQLGPALANLRFLENPNGMETTPYSILGGLTLSALIPDATQRNAIVELLLTAMGIQPSSLSSSPTEVFSKLFTLNDSDRQDVWNGMKNGFGLLAKRLPPELIGHRVTQWLAVGAALLTRQRLSQLKMPTLVLVGQDDTFLPSQREAKRLEQIIPSCQTITVKGSGHYVLDDRVNLTEAILYSKIDPLRLRQQQDKKKKYDPIKDWTLPPPDQVKEIIENRVQPLRRLVSPIFFSTDNKGKRWRGLGQLPSSDNDGPILFVANHQLFGLDLGMVIAQLLEERNLAVRGLAHPIIFQPSPQNNNADKEEETIPGQPIRPGIVNKDDVGNSPFDSQLFRRFGAVMVTPRNYHRLLQTGQNALLFPGGVREVFHGKDEQYQLFWPNSTDFVRTAAKFNATIITLAGIGAADSANILLDGPEMARLPFGIGEQLRNTSSNVVAARFDKTNDEELFLAPFAIPTPLPARHYFMFGKAMSTANLNYNDKEACFEFYKDVKVSLQQGLSDLLVARDQDPFKDSAKRIAYEQLLNNGNKQAPTFPTKLLNSQSSL